jgi:hypothetical protein
VADEVFSPVYSKDSRRKHKVPGVTKNDTDVTVVIGVLPARLPARAIEKGKDDLLNVPQTIITPTPFGFSG